MTESAPPSTPQLETGKAVNATTTGTQFPFTVGIGVEFAPRATVTPAREPRQFPSSYRDPQGQQAPVTVAKADPFYGHESIARICHPLPGQAPPFHSLCPPSHQAPLGRHLRSPHSFATLEGSFSDRAGSSGHRLFISAFMIASKVICDDTYSNKSWGIVAQGMFSLREINQMEREMCNYLDWELTVDNPILGTFEKQVLKVLLAEITGLAGSLEVLEVSGFRMDAGGPWAIETGKEFIVGGAPRLRFIAPTALTLPWESTCLKSPILTRVTLEQTAPGIDRLFDFLRDTPQLEVFEIGRLPWTDGDAFTPSAYPLVVMPNLKQLALSSYEWNPICTALSTIRMPLSAAQEKQVATFGGGPLKTGTWDLRAAYVSSLMGFFGGVIAPEEMEMYQEGDRGWEAVKVWMKHRVQWPNYDAHENGRPTLTFEDRDEWIKLGYGREWAFTPPLHYQSLWSLENLRVITVNETDDWAYGIPRDFWTLLGRLPKLEVIVVGAQKGFALQLFEELGKMADGVSVLSDSASRFPSLRAIVLNWSAAPSDPIYLDRDLGFNGQGDLEDTVTHLLQAFQSGDRRMLDELKLVFDAVLEPEDAALLRGVLSRLEKGGIAKRVGVWDMNRELQGEPNTI
ncbi:hypothetical protein NMY22_g17427 [Coprinellus aureogranulatus]|nr:hypothetical protein NMY22_g17427 [Coprinellus aureogranulatus]